MVPTILIHIEKSEILCSNILINVSTLTYMHQCNNKIHTDGNLNENINERFGILGGPLQPVLCRLAGHLVKTKILSEPHIL